MASELRVNTLKDANGNNTVATSFVASGSAKAWVNFDGTATNAAARGSFNNASMTDNGTGDYTITLSNAIDSTNNIVASGLCTDDGSTNNHVSNTSFKRQGSGNSPFTTTTVRMTSNFDGNTTTLKDMDFFTVVIHGDLA